MAKKELTLAWSEVEFDSDEFHKLLRNTGDEPVVLVFADDWPPSAETDAWDVYRIYPRELVNIHFAQYRPRVFLRGKRAEIDVLTTLTTLGSDGTAGNGQTITPKASGVM